MKTNQLLTKGSKNKAVVINNRVTIVYKDNIYQYYDNVCRGINVDEPFDETPFISFYMDYLSKKALSEERAEKDRLEALKNEISHITDIYELILHFKYDYVESCSHWNDLYNGTSRYAIKFYNKKDYENFLEIKDILNISGEFVELCRRDGHQHSKYSACYSLDEYQKACINHFEGNKYFYKSKENESESILECIKECETIDEVEKLITNYNEIEDGYYDCNGKLIISESALNNNNFTGYYEDVYSYCIGFRFELKSRLNEENETEEVVM